MSVLGDATADLEAAAGSVAGVRVHPLGAPITPPGVVISPPRLTPLSSCVGPGTATFAVHVVVALDDRALERLWELVVAVWEAVEDATPAVVTAADPGTFNSGTGEMPAYQLTVEYPI